MYWFRLGLWVWAMHKHGPSNERKSMLRPNKLVYVCAGSYIVASVSVGLCHHQLNPCVEGH